MIINFMQGKQWIEDHFGPEVARNFIKTGWQLDPFGHSHTFAKLLIDMEYESLFFARASEWEKNSRALNKSLEFMQ